MDNITMTTRDGKEAEMEHISKCMKFAFGWVFLQGPTGDFYKHPAIWNITGDYLGRYVSGSDSEDISEGPLDLVKRGFDNYREMPDKNSRFVVIRGG